MVYMGSGTLMDKGDLQLERLVKRYGNQVVVNEVSFHIQHGEFFSMLGPSGSGKTTTLMMIAGFAGVDGGRIAFGGRDITRLTPQQRQLGMVFQNYALFPHLSVSDNVAFPLRVRRLGQAEIDRKVAWALETVQLSEFAGRLPRQLSGGQQQRVALARAIVFQPQLILMDEPLGALDKNLRYHMQVELKEIQKALGMTVVYVTHDQEEAMNMSDRIAIMNNGRIEQIGKPHEVYQTPGSVFAAEFLGEANLLRGSVLDDSRLVHAYGEALAQSGAHCLFVRPERMRLLNDVAPGEHEVALEGHVQRVSFLGNIVRYAVALKGDATVTVDVQNDAAARHHSEGDGVSVVWHIADGRILNDG